MLVLFSGSVGTDPSIVLFLDILEQDLVLTLQVPSFSTEQILAMLSEDLCSRLCTVDSWGDFQP